MVRKMSADAMIMCIDELLDNAVEFEAEEDAYRYLNALRKEYEEIKAEELKFRQTWGIFS